MVSGSLLVLRHDIAEILLKVTLNTKINQSINQSKLIFIGIKLMM
jgi:hypothetical protein